MHEPNVIKLHTGPTNDKLVYFAECSCGWADIVDSDTRQAALDRHTNLHAPEDVRKFGDDWQPTHHVVEPGA